MDRLIDPVVADMQLEYEEATRQGGALRTRWTLWAGYVAFWKVAVLCVMAWTTRTIRTGTSPALARALMYAGAAVCLLTGILVADPVRSLPRLDLGSRLWLFVLLLPQSLPLTLPFGFLVGILSALQSRTLTMRTRGAMVGIGLVGSLVSWILIAWLIPAANQSFRETVARRVVVSGPAEMSWASLREQAVEMKSQSRAVQAGQFFMAYHERWAVVGTPPVFALFALGVVALRVSRAATAGMGVIGPALYISYLFELSNAETAVFSDERFALTFAWLPNVAMILMSVAFFCARHENDRASGSASAQSQLE